LFLIEMDQVVPWKGFIALIEPHYPKGEGDRPAYPLMAMLCMYLMQNWIRAKLEHPFRVIKHQFGYTKVRFRGLALKEQAMVHRDKRYFCFRWQCLGAGYISR
jgi:hypothetical protein